MRTAIADWKPVDKELEPNALRVVRSTSNHLVVAGPGAGKTELLAQRACFLLETNSCRVPRRILALCFKRDAARALRERVVLRCGPEAGRRFVSKTYDSFVKGMIDRLSSALPEEYRPSKPYRLVLSDADLRKEIDRALRTHAQGTDRRGFVSTNTVKQIFYTLPKKPFPLEASPTDAGSVLLLHVWAQLLAAKEGSALNFRLLTRLAEYLFATSTALRRALHATYSHVFLDEFQDTTGIQYDLVRGLFGGSQTVITAVGDTKQTIMAWAGALRGVFKSFESEFSARTLPLLLNHRSAPRLVQVQHILARRIDPQAAQVRSGPRAQALEGVCELHVFRDDDQEATRLAVMARSWVEAERVKAKDICVLTRQKPNVYGQRMIESFRGQGITARLEEKLQDLLSEPLVELLTDMCRLSIKRRAPHAWDRTLAVLAECRGESGIVPRRDRRTIDRELRAFAARIRPDLLRARQSAEDRAATLGGVFERCLELVGIVPFTRLHEQYLDRQFLAKTGHDLINELSGSFDRGLSWPQALDDLSGEFSTPVMTIHKSKGLEYDSVIFLGLEDGAFFNFAKQKEEETCAFFVALSRAKRRVIFTFAQERNGCRQSSTGVRDLHDALVEAGVNFVDWTSEE